MARSPSSTGPASSSKRRGWLRFLLLTGLFIAIPLALYIFIYQENRIEKATIRNFLALESATGRIEDVLKNSLGRLIQNKQLGIPPKLLNEVRKPSRGKHEVDCVESESRLDLEEKIITHSLEAGVSLLEATYDVVAKCIILNSGNEKEKKDELLGLLETLRKDLGAIPDLRKTDSIRKLEELLEDHEPIPDPHKTVSILKLGELLQDLEAKPDPVSILKLGELLKDLEAIPAPDKTDSIRKLEELIPGWRIPVKKLEAKADTISIKIEPIARISELAVFKKMQEISAEDSKSLVEVSKALSEYCGLYSSKITRLDINQENEFIAQVTDCRRFELRSPDVYKAFTPCLDTTGDSCDDLDPPTDSLNKILRAFDFFGTKLAVPLDDLVKGSTRHLEMFFDSYLLTDETGKVLFKQGRENFRLYTDVTEAEHRTKLAFTNHVDISELLQENILSGKSAGSKDPPVEPGKDSYGSSNLKIISVGGIKLHVFIHPIAISRISIPDVNDENRGGPDEGQDADSGRSVFYLVGIVNEDSFRQEALRLPLDDVVYVILSVTLIVTLLPVLWLRTSGDRLMLDSWRVAGIGIIYVIGIVIYAVLTFGILSGIFDKKDLDTTLKDIASRIQTNFKEELDESKKNLFKFSEKHAQNHQNSSDNWFEKKLLCRHIPRNSKEQDGLPLFSGRFFINDEGELTRCETLLTKRIQKLNLSFRDYFKKPKSGDLWYPDEFKENEACQDAESTPYFLDRIDSIVDGSQETVLSIPAPNYSCHCNDNSNKNHNDESVVAGIIRRFDSLEEAVLPPHFYFGVIDEDGRTLFHSHKERIMTLNFINSVSPKERFIAQLYSGTDRVTPLSYEGVPISALVMKLKDEIPWYLIVYRNHEVENDITVMTTLLTFVCMIIAIMGLIIVLLAWVYERFRKQREYIPKRQYLFRLLTIIVSKKPRLQKIALLILILIIVAVSLLFFWHRAILSHGLNDYVQCQVDETLELRQERYRYYASRYEQTREKSKKLVEDFYIDDMSEGCTLGTCKREEIPKCDRNIVNKSWRDIVHKLTFSSLSEKLIPYLKSVSVPPWGNNSTPGKVFESLLSCEDDELTQRCPGDEK